MPAFAGVFELPGRIAIKGHLHFLEEEFLHGDRTFSHQMLHRGRIGSAVTGFHYIMRQLFRIGGGFVNDAALCPVTVGHQGATKRKHLHFQTSACCLQGINRPCEAGANYQTVGLEGLHDLRVERLTGRVRLKSAAGAEWVRAPMLITSTPGKA